MRRQSWFVAVGLLVAGCSSGSATSEGTPSQVVVTIVTGIGTPQVFTGFPTTLPHSGSTLQVSAIDSVGAPIRLDPARYRFDVTPAVLNGFYVVTQTTNTVLGVTVQQAAPSVPMTWKLTDLVRNRIVVGPTVTNVVLQ